MRRSRKNEPEEQSEGAPEWLVTYSDLVTLLLTFFIMLFSMAVIDKQKFIEVANSLKSSFLHKSNGDMFNYNNGKDLISIMQANNSVDDGDLKANSGDDQEQERKGGNGNAQNQVEEFKNKIQQEIQKAKLSEFIKVIDENETITLRLNSVVLFDSGLADIKEEGKPILTKTALLLRNLDRDIEVQGHTDNLPINTILFPSNWELSTKRATNIVLFFTKLGVPPQKLTAAGNAEFRPVAPNDNEVNRQKNRRIDIVVMK